MTSKIPRPRWKEPEKPKPFWKRIIFSLLSALAFFGGGGTMAAKLPQFIQPLYYRVRVRETKAAEKEEKEEGGEELAMVKARPHKVVRGETLWTIAEKTYGDPERWIDIWHMNRVGIMDPNLIYVGQTIFLPQVEVHRENGTRPKTVVKEIVQPKREAAATATAFTSVELNLSDQVVKFGHSLRTLIDNLLGQATAETPEIRHLKNYAGEIKSFIDAVSKASFKSNLIDVAVNLLDLWRDVKNIVGVATFQAVTIAKDARMLSQMAGTAFSAAIAVQNPVITGQATDLINQANEALATAQSASNTNNRGEVQSSLNKLTVLSDAARTLSDQNPENTAAQNAKVQTQQIKENIQATLNQVISGGAAVAAGAAGQNPVITGQAVDIINQANVALAQAQAAGNEKNRGEVQSSLNKLTVLSDAARTLSDQNPENTAAQNARTQTQQIRENISATLNQVIGGGAAIPTAAGQNPVTTGQAVDLINQANAALAAAQAAANTNNRGEVQASLNKLTVFSDAARTLSDQNPENTAAQNAKVQTQQIKENIQATLNQVIGGGAAVAAGAAAAAAAQATAAQAPTPTAVAAQAAAEAQMINEQLVAAQTASSNAAVLASRGDVSGALSSAVDAASRTLTISVINPESPAVETANAEAVRAFENLRTFNNDEISNALSEEIIKLSNTYAINAQNAAALGDVNAAVDASIIAANLATVAYNFDSSQNTSATSNAAGIATENSQLASAAVDAAISEAGTRTSSIGGQPATLAEAVAAAEARGLVAGPAVPSGTIGDLASKFGGPSLSSLGKSLNDSIVGGLPAAAVWGGRIAAALGPLGSPTLAETLASVIAVGLDIPTVAVAIISGTILTGSTAPAVDAFYAARQEAQAATQAVVARGAAIGEAEVAAQAAQQAATVQAAREQAEYQAAQVQQQAAAAQQVAQEQAAREAAAATVVEQQRAQSYAAAQAAEAARAAEAAALAQAREQAEHEAAVAQQAAQEQAAREAAAREAEAARAQAEYQAAQVQQQAAEAARAAETAALAEASRAAEAQAEGAAQAAQAQAQAEAATTAGEQAMGGQPSGPTAAETPGTPESMGLGAGEAGLTGGNTTTSTTGTEPSSWDGGGGAEGGGGGAEGGGGGGSGCFRAGTFVVTAIKDNNHFVYEKIENLKIGDTIIGVVFDESGNPLIKNSVVKKLFIHEPKEYPFWKLETQKGAKIIATDNHGVINDSLNNVIPMEKLENGNLVVSAFSKPDWDKVLTTKFIAEEKVPVFNVKSVDTANYLVSQDGKGWLLVHNDAK